MSRYSQSPRSNRVTTVRPGESIQSALDRGDLVILAAGLHKAAGLRMRPGQALRGEGAHSRLLLSAPIEHDRDYSSSINGCLSDLTILGVTGLPCAVRLTNVYRFTVRNVYIDGAGGACTDACIELRNTGAFNCAAITIADCHLQNGSGCGIRSYRDGSGAGPSTVLISGGRIQAMTGYGVDMAAGLVSVPALETSIHCLDIEGCGGGVRGSFHSAEIRGCHFEQGNATLPEGAHIAVRGGRRADALTVSGCFFSGSEPYAINVGDPNPAGTIARGVTISGNKFSSYGVAALRLRHCSGVAVTANRVAGSGILLLPQDTWEHNDSAEVQGPAGTVQSCKVQVIVEDYQATMFDRFISVAAENVTITLPLAAELSSDGGQRLTIRSRVSGTVVIRQGTDTIGGQTEVSLGAGEVLDLVSSLSTTGASADLWEPCS